jgi:RNA polymerase sigma-70 factor (sigma-E family)
VSVGGDHGVTGSYASAAGVVPRVADPVMPESVPHGIDHNVRAVPVPDSGNGAARHQEAQPRAPVQRRRGEARDPDATRQPPLVPSARAVDDGALPARAAGIDDPEFRDYVRSRSRALLRTAYLLTGNMADAEDLLQSALAKTYLAWDRIEDRGALDGYVRRALVNTHISWWRRRRLEEYPTDEIPDQAVVDHSVSSELQESLRRAIDRLPQRMRAAVMLRYYDDMSEAEVAEVLGVSLGTVKSTVSRAVAKLRIDAELQPE